jgi:hypothetical protein
MNKQKMLKALKGMKGTVLFSNGCKAVHMGSTWYFWYNHKGDKVVDFIPT